MIGTVQPSFLVLFVYFINIWDWS